MSLRRLESVGEVNVARLRMALQSDDQFVVTAACHVLGINGIESRAAVDDLLQASTHPEARVREAAAEALARISADDEKIEIQIAHRLADSNPDVRNAAVYTLQACQPLGPEAQLVVENYARSENEDIAAAAKEALRPKRSRLRWHIAD